MTVKTANFNPETDTRLRCSCGCDGYEVQQWALDKLQEVREAAGRPLTLRSGYRCPNHESERKKATPGQHNKGVAFDLRSANGNGFLTRDSVIDFTALIYDHTGVTFGTGITQGASPQGYAVHIKGTDIIISHVTVDPSTGEATIIDLKTATIVSADYDGVENDYRLRILPSDGSAVGVKIQFYRYVNGLPVLAIAYDSEVDEASKRAIPAVGWVFGGYWDYGAGSAGETLRINGGTVYASVE